MMQLVIASQQKAFSNDAIKKAPFFSLLLLILIMLSPMHASAAEETNDSGIPAGTCTSQEEFDITDPASGEGMISGIIERIKEPLQEVAEDTFNGIVQNADFINVLRITASIYVALYGIFFTLGMVQITVHDLLVRLCKIAIIGVLLSGNAWNYCNAFVVSFFNGAVDDIISHVSAIALDINTPVVGSPFDPLDQALVYVASVKMVDTILATFATGPYGFAIGIILVMGLGSFFKALFNALWIYVMAYVIRTLMFSMAPIFITCILFQRTRHLFDGWLNQIINATLQPIFLFTFFAFFVILIKSCMQHVLQVPVCWMPTTSGSGTPGIWHFWRFAIMDCNGADPATDANGLQSYLPFDGTWGIDGPEGPNVGECNTQVHPIGIILPLTIWILADLAGRFNHIVLEIARGLADTSTDLSMGAEGMKKWFSNATDFSGYGSKSAGATGARSAPASLADIGRMLKDNPPPSGDTPPRPRPGDTGGPGTRKTPGA